jgi:hypothetical protein
MPQAIPFIVKAGAMAAKAGAVVGKGAAAGAKAAAAGAAHAGSAIGSTVGQALGGAGQALKGGAGAAKQVAVNLPGVGQVTGVTSPAGPVSAAGKMAAPVRTATSGAVGQIMGVGGKAMEAQPKLAALETLVMGGKGSESVTPATVNQRPLPQLPADYQAQQPGGDLAQLIAKLLGGQR